MRPLIVQRTRVRDAVLSESSQRNLDWRPFSLFGSAGVDDTEVASRARAAGVKAAALSQRYASLTPPDEKGLVDPKALDALIERYEHEMGPHKRAKVVARVWSDPAYKARLLTRAHCSGCGAQWFDCPPPCRRRRWPRSRRCRSRCAYAAAQASEAASSVVPIETRRGHEANRASSP